MSEGNSTAKMFCPTCGQKLAVPTSDLRVRLRCPRCQSVRAASELVPVRKTVPAVPESAFDELNEAVVAPPAIEAGYAGRSDRTTLDDLPPATRPIPTMRMPEASTKPGGAAAPPPHYEMLAPPPLVVTAPQPLPQVTPPQPPAASLVHGAWHGPHQRGVPAALPPAPGPPMAFGPTQAPPGTPPVDLAARAAAGVVAGAAAMARYGSGALRAATWADHLLRGRRPLVLGLASVFVLVAPFIDQRLVAPVVSVVALVFFVVVLATMALARIDSFRDAQGWKASLVLRTLGEASSTVWEGCVRVAKAAPGQKMLDLAKPALLSGLCLSATVSLLAALGLSGEALAPLQGASTTALAVGAALFGAGHLWLRRTAKTTGLTLDAATAPIANDAVRALPLVLDCRDPRMVEAVVNGTKHPLVRALIVELAKPWPRPHYGDEREFQDRLLKRLQTAMPEADPRTERWIGERERADLLLGDDQAGVLLELKAWATTTTIRDLIGQAWTYLRVWRGRGPMLLVLFKTEPEIAARLKDQLALMRKEGHAVLTVLAAP